jgi:hypothetical protein
LSLLRLLCFSWADTKALAHTASIRLGLQTDSPSAAKAKAIPKQQRKYPFYNGRPPENSGFDVRLFHPVFGNFCRRYRGNEGPTEEKEAAVRDLLVFSANHYEGEDARQATVKPVLDILLGRHLEDIRNPDGTYADGVLAYSSVLVPLLLELKNEVGADGSDLTFQAALTYRKYWSHRKVL